MGIIGLLTNEAVLNVYTLNSLEILTIIGIGLGIGSLKEYITKIV